MSTYLQAAKEFFQHALTYAQAQIGSAGTQHLGYQWLIILFILFVLVMVMFMLGRSRGVLMILSLYITALIEPKISTLSYIKPWINGIAEWQLHIGIFVALAVIVFFIFNKTYLQRRVSTSESSSWSVIPLSALAIGFSASIILSFIEAQQVFAMPALLHVIFVTKNAQLIWTLLPLAGIFFLDRE